MGFMDALMPWGLFGLLFTGIWALLTIGVYVWVALCLYTIARKTNTENPWLAWIPIANIILACQIAGKPWWWIFLFFIPIVNIVLGIIVMWNICEARGKPGWLGLLVFILLSLTLSLGPLAFVGENIGFLVVYIIITVSTFAIPGIVAFTD